MKIGLFFKSDRPNAYLQKFSFWLQKHTAPDTAALAPLIISPYKVSTNALTPSDTLLAVPIVYYPKRQGKQAIKFNDKDILLPDQGVFIVFQYIMDPKYSWKQPETGTTLRGLTSPDRIGMTLIGATNRKYPVLIAFQNNPSWYPEGYDRSIKFEAVVKACD